MKTQTDNQAEVSCAGDYIRVQANMIDDAFNALRDQVLKAENADSLTQGVEKDKVLSLVLLFDQGVMEAVNNILSAIKDVDDKPDQVVQLKPVTNQDRVAVNFTDSLDEQLRDIEAMGLLIAATDHDVICIDAITHAGTMITDKARTANQLLNDWWDKRK